MSYQKSRNKRQDICQHAQLTSVLKIKCAYSKKKQLIIKKEPRVYCQKHSNKITTPCIYIHRTSITRLNTRYSPPINARDHQAQREKDKTNECKVWKIKSSFQNSG